VPRRRLPTG